LKAPQGSPVAGAFRTNELHRARPAQKLMLGEVYFAHAARAEFLGQSVLPQLTRFKRFMLQHADLVRTVNRHRHSESKADTQAKNAIREKVRAVALVLQSDDRDHHYRCEPQYADDKSTAPPGVRD